MNKALAYGLIELLKNRVERMSHLSKLPLARNLPQGEKATLYTGSLCLFIMQVMLVTIDIIITFFIVIVIRIIVLVIITVVPVRVIIIIVNLVNVWTQVPFSTSHRRTVESKLAEARTWKEWITN